MTNVKERETTPVMNKKTTNTKRSGPIRFFRNMGPKTSCIKELIKDFFDNDGFGGGNGPGPLAPA